MDDKGERCRSGASLEEIRTLELRYSSMNLDKTYLFVEYAGGRVMAFKVERELLGELVERIQHRRGFGSRSR